MRFFSKESKWHHGMLITGIFPEIKRIKKEWNDLLNWMEQRNDIAKSDKAHPSMAVLILLLQKEVRAYAVE